MPCTKTQYQLLIRLEIANNNLVPGKYVLVEETTIAGYILPDNPNTTFTLDGGEHQVVVVENVRITPTPTPTTTYRPRSTPTPVITATPTPIPSGDITIEEEDTPYGPETGEGDMLFIGIGALLLLALVLLVIRKKLVK